MIATSFSGSFFYECKPEVKRSPIHPFIIPVKNKKCNLQLRIKKLRQHIILRSITGVLVLCTFLLSITPKQLLHNLSANHKDLSAKRTSDKLQYSISGFNCDCNNIVATSPFTETPTSTEITGIFQFPLFTESKPITIFSADRFYFNLRGPPAIA